VADIAGPLIPLKWLDIAGPLITVKWQCRPFKTSEEVAGIAGPLIPVKWLDIAGPLIPVRWLKLKWLDNTGPSIPVADNAAIYFNTSEVVWQCRPFNSSEVADIAGPLILVNFNTSEMA
jgi:hypothetical protein